MAATEACFGSSSSINSLIELGDLKHVSLYAIIPDLIVEVL